MHYNALGTLILIPVKPLRCPAADLLLRSERAGMAARFNNDNKMATAGPVLARLMILEEN